MATPQKNMRLTFLLFVLLLTSVGYGETLRQFEGKTLSLPFATEEKLGRVCEDFELNADLTAFDEFRLTIDVQNPIAIGNVALYFRSGDGWYRFSTPTLKAGLQTLVFPAPPPTKEGSPDGFDKIDYVRIAFWRGIAVDSSVTLEKLEAKTLPILFVAPDYRAEEERKAAMTLQQMFRTNDVPVVSTTKNVWTPEKLQGRKILLTSESFDEPIDPIGGDTITRITYFSDGSLKYGEKVGTDTFSMLSLLCEADPALWPILILKKAEALESIGQLPEGYEESLSSKVQIAPAIKDGTMFQGQRQNVDLYAKTYKELYEAYETRVAAYLQSLPSKPNEFRAWWEHAGTGAYPGDWDRTMKELSENGFNAVFPNMLWGGAAHYESDLLPQSAVFERYGDQIAQAVAAGKKYGVEVHVWKVNFNASYVPKTREFINDLRAQGRLQRKQNGEEVPWLCPSHPLNRKLEHDSMIEVAEKYDVDGIHYDYIRYPGEDYCYCDGCKERFTDFLRSQGLLKADETLNWPGDCFSTGRFKPEYDQWRCDHITALVAAIHTTVKEKNLKVKISGAVFSEFPERVFQEWPLWVERGYLDFVCPMNYTTCPAQFSDYIKAQLELTGHKIPIYPGIGATATGIWLKPEDVAAQIEIARQNGLGGFTIFNLNQATISEIPPALATGPTK